VLSGVHHAQGLTWNPELNTFIVATSPPSSPLTSEPSQLIQITQQGTRSKTYDVSTSGALSDLTWISPRLIAGITSTGKLIYFYHSDQGWERQGERRIFNDGLLHKTATLAWDPKRETFMSCEREGDHQCYWIDREARVVAQFKLNFGPLETTSMGTLIETIDGAYIDPNYLYLLGSQSSQLLLFERSHLDYVGSITLGLTSSIEGLTVAENQLWIVSQTNTGSQLTSYPLTILPTFAGSDHF
jgi:hypothetical protein